MPKMKTETPNYQLPTPKRIVVAAFGLFGNWELEVGR